MSWVTDNMKSGDKIYTLDKYHKEIIEWTIIIDNPVNPRFFIVVNKAGNVTQIMKTFIQYSSYEHNFPAPTKELVIERFKNFTENTIKELQKKYEITNPRII